MTRSTKVGLVKAGGVCLSECSGFSTVPAPGTTAQPWDTPLSQRNRESCQHWPDTITSTHNRPPPRPADCAIPHPAAQVKIPRGTPVMQKGPLVRGPSDADRVTGQEAALTDGSTASQLQVHQARETGDVQLSENPSIRAPHRGLRSAELVSPVLTAQSRYFTFMDL